MNDYEALCQVTKSDKFYGNLIPMRDVLDKLGAAAVALGALDAVKKTLFYGREYPHPLGSIGQHSMSLVEDWCADVHHQVDIPTADAIDVVHSILGTATEAGEQIELLLSTFKTKVFDSINFGEEIGDGQWYTAIGCTAVGTTIDMEQMRNIKKLRTRFGGKFTEYYANNRNLKDEREVLEVGLTASMLTGTQLDQRRGVMPLEQRTKMEALERFYKAALDIDAIDVDVTPEQIEEKVKEYDNAKTTAATFL